MQDIHSDERYSLFTQAVLESAEREATALILGAEKEKADMLRAAAHNVAEEEYQKLMQEAAHKCMRLSAQAAQDVRRELLNYRECLCNEIANKVQNLCVSFCQSDKYEAFIAAKLSSNAALLNEGGASVHVRKCDVELALNLCKAYKDTTVCVDDEIELGGLRIIRGNKIFDETLDTGLCEEKESFLSYCDLKVV